MRHLYEKIDQAISMLLEIQEHMMIADNHDDVSSRLQVIKSISTMMCHRAGITYEDVIKPNRTRQYSDIRKVISGFLHEKGYKKIEISACLERDHSTVITMIRHHFHLMKHDDVYQDLYKLMTNEQKKTVA